ncbi:MAG: DUF4173 domain-containing protein [Gemmatimonadota bacterium]
MQHPDSGLPAGPAAAIALNLPAGAVIPSRRAVIARRALQGALVLGVLADVLLRDGPWGIGLLVWMVLFATVSIALARKRGEPLTRESWTWLGIAVLFAGGLSWRDAEMLRFFNVLAMLAALVLLVMSVDTVSLPALAAARVRDLIRAAFETGIDAGTGVIPLLMRDADLQSAARTGSDRSARRIGRAALIAAPIFFVFALLLTRADPVFGSFLEFLDVDFDVLMSHIVITGFFAWIVAGWLRRSFVVNSRSERMADSLIPFTLGATDVVLVLGALNVLFAVFVLVQIGSLFGGEAWVLKTTGLSFAEYARRGFFELTVVAGLLLAVLLSVQALIPAAESRTLRNYRRLAVPLVLLLGAVIFSAGARMKLYMHYYGLSVDRVYATAFMTWLAFVFVWFAATVLRSRPRAFATGLVVSAFVVLFTLNVMDPDALVARENLARLDVQ